MFARHRSPHAQSGLVAALAALVLLCGLGPLGCGPAQDTDHETESADIVRFAFIRTANALIRIDSASGMTWFAPGNGDGGWTPLGGTPATLGAPQENGRYAIYSLGGGRRQTAAPDLDILRVDRASGRSWLGVARDGADWTEIADPDGAVAPPADTRAPTAAADSAASTPAPTPEPAPLRRTTTNSPTQMRSDFGLVAKERLGGTPEEREQNLEVVVRALKKEGLPVELKVWAARQLGAFDPDLAVPPLLEALDSAHPEVVVAAIGSLQQAGSASSIPSILKLKEHSDPRVRAAVEAVVIEVR